MQQGQLELGPNLDSLVSLRLVDGVVNGSRQGRDEVLDLVVQKLLGVDLGAVAGTLASL